MDRRPTSTCVYVQLASQLAYTAGRSVGGRIGAQHGVHAIATGNCGCTCCCWKRRITSTPVSCRVISIAAPCDGQRVRSSARTRRHAQWRRAR